MLRLQCYFFEGENYLNCMHTISMIFKHTFGGNFMSFIKRVTATVSASFENVVGQIENHHALVQQAIKEMKQSGIKARNQLSRVRRDTERLKQKEEELTLSIARWQTRAKEVAGDDRTKALECLKRKKQAEENTKIVQQSLKAQIKLESSLTKDLATINNRLDELTRKKNLLLVKENSAKTLELGKLSDVSLLQEVDEIFERWELRIGDYEGYQGEQDSFENEFVEIECDAELNKELDDLLK